MLDSELIIYFLILYFVFFTILFFFFFFFSSRRRHTRCLSDWSSDVCSSDLVLRVRGAAAISEEQNFFPVMERASHLTCGFYDKVRLRQKELGLHADTLEIGRASCRERSVDHGGRRINKKKNRRAQKRAEGVV